MEMVHISMPNDEHVRLKKVPDLFFRRLSAFGIGDVNHLHRGGEGCIHNRGVLSPRIAVQNAAICRRNFAGQNAAILYAEV